MANKTTNYKLTKPLESEFYDVGVQNENMDKIDTQMKANADAIEALQKGQSGKAIWWTVRFPPNSFLT